MSEKRSFSFSFYFLLVMSKTTFPYLNPTNFASKEETNSLINRNNKNKYNNKKKITGQILKNNGRSDPIQEDILILFNFV